MSKAGIELLNRVQDQDEIRVKNAKRLRATMSLGGWNTTIELEASHCVYWQCIVFVSDKEQFTQRLQKTGFDTASINLSLLPELDICQEFKKDCSIACQVKNRRTVYCLDLL